MSFSEKDNIMRDRNTSAKFKKECKVPILTEPTHVETITQDSHCEKRPCAQQRNVCGLDDRKYLYFILHFLFIVFNYTYIFAF